jgi:hypothetical protein
MTSNDAGFETRDGLLELATAAATNLRNAIKAAPAPLRADLMLVQGQLDALVERLTR